MENNDNEGKNEDLIETLSQGTVIELFVNSLKSNVKNDLEDGRVW